jgi:periplasmic divalent cation tolerance protein
MSKSEHLIIFCTVPDAESGNKISRALLGKKLAACVNAVPGIQSQYWWNENIESDKEYQLIIKTRRILYPKLEKVIRDHHPYDVPEIVAVPIVSGNPDYLRWIENETRQ